MDAGVFPIFFCWLLWFLLLALDGSALDDSAQSLSSKERIYIHEQVGAWKDEGWRR